jgi:hypothetical protein
VPHARAARDAQCCQAEGTCLHVGVAGGDLQGGHLEIEQAAAQRQGLGALGGTVGRQGRLVELLLDEALGVGQRLDAQEGAPRGTELRERCGWGESANGKAMWVRLKAPLDRARVCVTSSDARGL